MRIPRPRRTPIAESVLPMINIVFLLLIFFMLAGAISATDVFEITPPDSRSAQPARQTQALLLLDAQGRLALDSIPIDDRSLTHVLSARLAEAPDTVLHLKADGRVPAERVVAIMEAVRDAGASTLILKTLAPAR